MQLPLLKDISQLTTRWKSILDPILARPYNNGILLEGIVLINGTNLINHSLGRNQQGWLVTDTNASANLYRSQPFNDTTLFLVSSAAVTVNLWVF